MSAGAYEGGKYLADDGKVWRCKVQPETKGLTIGGVANAYPTDAFTTGLPRLTVSKSRKQQGVRPRYVTVVLTANGTGATAEYLSGTKHNVVVFDKDVFETWELQQTGTYLGINCQLVFKSGEASS